MKKIETYVLNGFLGSGKTTLLLKMLRHFKEENKKVAVILNELGAVNVESHMFEEQSVIELLNGCICCTIQDDLSNTLKLLANQHVDENIDVLLLEGTGVAHPRDITEVFSRAEMQEVFQLKSTIGVVDASHFLDYLSIFASSKEIRTLLKEQVQHSTVVLLNKIDRVNEKEKVKIQKKIDSIKEVGVPVYLTSFSNIDIKRLSKAEEITEKMSNENPHNHTHHHHHHDSSHGDIVTIKLDNIPIVEKRILTKWLNSLPKDVIRAKGLVKLKGEPYLTHVQYADNVARYTSLGKNDNRNPVFILIGKELKMEMFHPLSKVQL